MKRITVWLFSTVAAVVLLFSYRTSTGGGVPPAVAATTPANIPATDAPGASGSGSSSGTSTPPSGTSTTAKTYTGSVAGTRWGDVQVAVTVASGKITSVSVPVYPNGNGRDQEINAYALPTLVQETLQAQNANINTVSGATVTSDGYLQSLQSALDAAGLK